MLNTFRGTVESDPMRIPAPSRAAQSGADSFANALEEATAPRDPRPEPTPEPVTDVDDELAALTPEELAADAAESDATAVEDAQPAADLPEGAERPIVRFAEANDDTQRRGEAGWQKAAGKGTDSPRTSNSTQGGEPMLAELVELAARSPLRAGVTVTVAPTTVGSAVASTVGSGEPLLRGVGASGTRGQETPTAETVKPGYRTSNAATVQMLEHARESIFKQILLKITGDGGEMRMRLDPPELGELDLRMVVSKGNKVSLSIGAERPEMADLIQRHITELASTLAGIGLELTNADVHARDADEPREDTNQDGDANSSANTDELDDTQRPMRGGYIRADGLDFWV